MNEKNETQKAPTRPIPPIPDSTPGTDAYLWYCELENRSMWWIDERWPYHCPICGRGVNRDMSTHHWIGE